MNNIAGARCPGLLSRWGAELQTIYSSDCLIRNRYRGKCVQGQVIRVLCAIFYFKSQTHYNHSLKRIKKEDIARVYTAQCCTRRYVCIDRTFSRLLGFYRKIIGFLFLLAQNILSVMKILQTIATIASLTSVQDNYIILYQPKILISITQTQIEFVVCFTQLL